MIVTEFKGDIDLISEFGKGSSFFFSFEIMEFIGEINPNNKLKLNPIINS